MEQIQQTFVIVGGDLRQTYLAKKFLEQGFPVYSYGMKEESSLEGIVVMSQLKEAIASSNHIILPIPFTHDHINILHEGEKPDMAIAEFMQLIQKGQHIFGGCLSEELKTHCNSVGALYTDFMEQDDVAIYNTVATAEGIIAEAIMSYPGNLQGNQALVLGYGKCAKTLAKKLNALDVTVTVAARNKNQILWAKTDGYHTCFLEDLPDIIGTVPLIFNTVPNTIIPDQDLLKIRKDAWIYDIASAPGGYNRKMAIDLGIHSKVCPGLPGKYAPEASAAALLSCILSIL